MIIAGATLTGEWGQLWHWLFPLIVSVASVVAIVVFIQSLVEAAHQVCPYSNATRGNIDVTLSVVE